RSAMSIVPADPDAAKLRRSGMDSGDIALLRTANSAVRTQIYAAPTELGGHYGTSGYRHGAPNGACCMRRHCSLPLPRALLIFLSLIFLSQCLSFFLRFWLC